MRRPAAWAMPCLVLLGLLAGCVEPAASMDEPCRVSADRIGGLLGANAALPQEVDPTQPQDLVYVRWGLPRPEAIEAWPVPPAQAQGPDRLDVYGPEGGAGFVVVARFDALLDGNLADGLGASWLEVVPRGGCYSEHAVHDVRTPVSSQGELAAVGGGAFVRTAGFLEDGTLFYTNIAAIHDAPVPRVAWYAWEGDEPLRVYIYDQDRSERPATWAPPSSHASDAPSPVAGPALDALAGAEASAGVGYFTTIKGFNEALKGLSTTTQRVVHIAPEDAYTRPGNEAHPLYGAALLFLIDVVGTTDVPCPRDACPVTAEVLA